MNEQEQYKQDLETAQGHLEEMAEPKYTRGIVLDEAKLPEEKQSIIRAIYTDLGNIKSSLIELETKEYSNLTGILEVLEPRLKDLREKIATIPEEHFKLASPELHALADSLDIKFETKADFIAMLDKFETTLSQAKAEQERRSSLLKNYQPKTQH